jgi:hypothetical protein
MGRNILLQLVGDGSSAKRVLAETATEVENFGRTKAEATITVESAKAKATLDEFKASEKNLDATALIKLQADAAETKLTGLKDRLKVLQDQPTSVKIEAQSGRLAGQIDRVQLQLDRLHGRTIEENVEINKESISKAEGEGHRMGAGIKAAIGAGLLGLGAILVSQVNAAIGSVDSLYEGAQQLHTTTGISLSDAAQLKTALDAMGISTQTYLLATKTLDTAYTSVQKGGAAGKTAMASFTALGITQKALNATGGSSVKIFDLVNAHLAAMAPSAAKTAASAKLLGRGFQGLNPILRDGGKELASVQKFAKSMGVQISNTGDIEKAKDAQFKWKVAMQAAQLFIVDHVIPTLLELGKWITTNVIPPIKAVVGWFKQHKQVSHDLVGVLKILIPMLIGMKVVSAVIGPFKSAHSAIKGFWGAAKTATGWAKGLGRWLGVLAPKAATAGSDLENAGTKAGGAATKFEGLKGKIGGVIDKIAGSGGLLSKLASVKSFLGALGLAAALTEFGNWLGNKISGGKGISPGSSTSHPLPNAPGGDKGANVLGLQLPPGPGSSIIHEIGGLFGAEGAIVRKPVRALIGERGPEALIPLSRAPGASPLPFNASALSQLSQVIGGLVAMPNAGAAGGSSAPRGGGGGHGGGNTYNNFNITTPGGSAPDATHLAAQLQQRLSAMGAAA